MSHEAREEKKAIEPTEEAGDGREAVGSGADADAALTEDLDIEMALLALSARDVGEPTEAVDLSSLSPAEKRILLEMLRRRLYGSDAPYPPSLDSSPSDADAGSVVA